MIETSYSSSVGSAMAMEGNINPWYAYGVKNICSHRTYRKIHQVGLAYHFDTTATKFEWGKK